MGIIRRGRDLPKGARVLRQKELERIKKTKRAAGKTQGN
jgi:hypothetical protein